jgi:hypothetical protein
MADATETEPNSPPTPKRPRLRWYQYSLRSMMLFTLLWALACSWLANTIKNQQRQYDAAKALKKAGWSVSYNQTWLGKILRRESLVNVTSARCFSQDKITDADLVRLQDLRELESLEIKDTAITDAGLVHLRSLGRLKHLDLHDTNITDAGLAHLRELRLLNLQNTKVTDAGVKALQKALPHCRVELGRPISGPISFLVGLASSAHPTLKN